MQPGCSGRCGDSARIQVRQQFLHRGAQVAAHAFAHSGDAMDACAQNPPRLAGASESDQHLPEDVVGGQVRRISLVRERQMPGGVVSNLKSQLAPLGIAHRLPEVLEEAARVRRELGYPIIVSPFAQFVMTQAVLNVMGKERYAAVPDEVRKYVLGYYGEIAGPIDPNLYDRITNGAKPTSARPGDLLEPGVPKIRRERGPFASDDDLLLAAFYARREYDALKAAGPINTTYPLASTPLLTLLKEITQRRDIRSIHLVQQAR